MKVVRQPRPRALVLLALALLTASIAILLGSFGRPPLQELLVAKQDLASGVLLESSQFARIKTDLGSSASRYVSNLPIGQALITPLRAGELLAQSAIGSIEPLHSVVLTPSQPISAGVTVGSRVDVWFVAKAQSGFEPLASTLVATGLEVRAVNHEEQGGSYLLTGTTVEVAASEADLPALVLASADGGFISVIAKQ
jgi:hypothetical protein